MAPDVSLAHYFDDTRVETLLTVYDEKSSGGQLGETLTAAYDGIKRGIKRAAAAGVLASSGGSTRFLGGGWWRWREGCALWGCPMPDGSHTQVIRHPRVHEAILPPAGQGQKNVPT